MPVSHRPPLHHHFRPPSFRSWGRSWGFDALAVSLVLAALAFVAWNMASMNAPLPVLQMQPVTLDVHNLPEYAMRTTLRMLIAVLLSLLFTLAYATLAAKSRRAGMVLIPLLDVLQAVPVLGYISFTVTAFVALFPGSVLGVEMAAIFAIFTSQVWNMTFSLTQSLQSVPRDADEAARAFRLSGWQKFWKLELPFAMPSLVGNMMVSMSGGWFFVVASEAITVGNQQFILPGIGSYIALAIAEQNLHAIGAAIIAMATVILLYDQLLFRPLVAWADKFRYEMTASIYAPRSWVLTLFRKSRLMTKLFKPLGKATHAFVHCWRKASVQAATHTAVTPWKDRFWILLLLLLAGLACWRLAHFFSTALALDEVVHVVGLGFVTLLRVMVLIALASLLWVPVGIFIGLRPRLAAAVQPLTQFLAAFPANVMFPLAVVGISHYQLNPNIWLSPLMILGAQWYILFNVIAGAANVPNDLREAAQNLNIRGWMWWRKVMLPGVMPAYLIGALTAAGGAWNASIVAEAVQWGDKSLFATGLGAYIAAMTTAGDYPRIALGVGIMALMVVLCNRLFWRPLQVYAMRKLRLD
jgi:NitT/TauT family transport system permease protein